MMKSTNNKIDLILDRKTFLTFGAVASMGLMTGSLFGCDKQSGKPAEQPTSSAGDAPSADADTKSGVAATDDGLIKRTTFAFDTLVFLTAYGPDACLDECVQLCAKYDDLFSAHKEGTDIWRINTAKGAPTEVNPDTADLIKKSLEFCEVSGGTFDITVGAVSLLWDFDNGVKPDDAAIQEGLKHIDYKKVKVEGNTVTLLDPEAKLDLGGTAKGWIADKFAEVYHKHGVEAGIINLGGNVMAVGEKPNGDPWVIAVRDPNNPEGEYLLTVKVKNKSVVTSGLYERHFTLDGVDYTHILDVKTGYPAKTDVLSDTIISETSIEGDGLSTTLFLDGIDKSIELIKKFPDAEALFIDKDNLVHFTENFAKLYPYEMQSTTIKEAKPAGK